MFDGVQKQNRKLAKAVRNGASDGLIINKNLDRDPEKTSQEQFLKDFLEKMLFQFILVRNV